MSEENKEKTKLVKHAENPFLNVHEITYKNQQVLFSNTSQDHEVALLNQSTGETTPTQVVSYRRVDDEEFVKLFTANIALTFNLSPSGRKVFDLLLRVMQKTAIGKDQVYLSDEVREEALEEFPRLKLGKSTFYRGIDDLIKNQIIARSKRTNVYFINPHLVFNGNRLTITQHIERKQEKEIEDEKE